jgi:IMP dehydrogenase
MEFTLPTAFTFDDVLLRPGYSGFDRSDITTTTQFSRNISIKTPLVSSPMDTVTESKLAIALAKAGGIGIIHRNLTIEQQAKEVKTVKRAKCLVAAAVGSSTGYEARVKALVAAGADAILVDSAHGYAKKVIEAVQYIKKHYSVDVVAGSVATAEGAQALIDAGVDALRVGMGPGAICSTRIMSGMGVPQLTALLEVASIARDKNIPMIADGGIVYSGDMVKALAAGASTIMMGRMFAATEESPGEVVELTPDHVPGRFQNIINGSDHYVFKTYRGMGSLGAMQRGLEVSSEDEFHGKNYQGDALIAEGVEGLVPCTGTVEELVGQMMGGIHSGMYYMGTETIPALWENASFIQITQASLTESHPHDLFITNPGGNYS